MNKWEIHENLENGLEILLKIHENTNFSSATIGTFETCSATYPVFLTLSSLLLKYFNGTCMSQQAFTERHHCPTRPISGCGTHMSQEAWKSSMHLVYSGVLENALNNLL